MPTKLEPRPVKDSKHSVPKIVKRLEARRKKLDKQEAKELALAQQNGQEIEPQKIKRGAPKPRDYRYLVRMYGIVTLDEWGKVVRKTLSLAKMGDINATRFLAEYLIGRPSQRVDIVRNDNNGIADDDITDSQAKVRERLDQMNKRLIVDGKYTIIDRRDK